MQTVHADTPADHDAHVLCFLEYWTSPEFVEQPPDADTPHDHESPTAHPEPTDDESAAATRAMLAKAAKPKRKPGKTSKGKKPQPKRPGNPSGSTFEDRDVELVRGVLIDRLDVVLLSRIDDLLDQYGVCRDFKYDIIQAVQLGLFPEEFAEPPFEPGLIPDPAEARAILAPVNGDRFRLFVEALQGRTPADRKHSANAHRRLADAVLSA